MGDTVLEWWRRGVLAVGLAGLMAGSGAVVAAADTPDDLVLRFNHGTWGFVGDQVFQNDGVAAADISLVTANRPVTMFRSGFGGWLSLQFPEYSGTREGNYAALRVTPLGEDWLNPGTSPFSFGADLRLNEVNEGSGVDNGNNVVQRGLWDDPMQFKLEVDHNRPNCVVRGSEGRLGVTSRVTVEPDKWYRVRCQRSGELLTISVEERGSGDAPVVTGHTGPIGSLEADKGTPLSVGAKLYADGEIVRSDTDQFNGRIDNVFYSD
jgi:hypothetical protein